MKHKRITVKQLKEKLENLITLGYGDKDVDSVVLEGE